MMLERRIVLMYVVSRLLAGQAGLLLRCVLLGFGDVR